MQGFTKNMTLLAKTGWHSANLKTAQANNTHASQEIAGTLTERD